MRFLNITVHNFLSFEDASLDLDEKGLVLVQGENLDSDAADGNGSGKSTLIVEALLFGLFGKTARGIKGSSVVRRGSRDGTYVQILWMQMQGDKLFEYAITRWQDHPKQKNKLSFVQTEPDCVDLTTTDKNRTQDLINETLGFTSDVALHALVLGQKSLSFVGATDAIKKGIFETVLDFAALNRAEAKAKGQLVLVKEDKQKLENEQAKTEGHLTALENELEQIQQLEAAWDDGQSRKIAEIDNRINDKKNRVATIGDITPQINYHTQTIAALENQLKEYPALQGQERDIPNDISHREETCSMVEGILGELSAVINHKDSTCPHCGQILPPQLLAKIKQRKKEAKEQYDKYKQEITDSQRYIILKRLQLAAIHSMVGNLTNVVQVRDALHGQRVHLEALDRELILLESEIGSLIERLTLTYEEKNPYADRLTSIKESLKDAKDRKAANILQTRSLELRCRSYEYWVQGFGKKGLQSFLLDQVTPFLTDKANEYTRVLCDDEMTLHFKTTTTTQAGNVRDDFTVMCVNKYGADCYEGQSAGEQNRIDLAVAIALQDLVIARLGTDMNFSVFDECVPFTDRTGVERVVQLLHKISEQRSTVFFVTHNPYYREHFQKQLTVVKEGGISRVQKVRG